MSASFLVLLRLDGGDSSGFAPISLPGAVTHSIVHAASAVVPRRAHHQVVLVPKAAPHRTRVALPSALSAVVTPGCDGCVVRQVSGGGIHVSVGGRSAHGRSAFALFDFGGSSGLAGAVHVRDRIALSAGQVPKTSVSVLQVTDVGNRVVYGLQIDARTRMLRFLSPPGSLAAGGLDLSTGARVPNDGTSSTLVDISAGANRGLRVTVDGRVVILRTTLRGGKALRQRFLAVGVLSSPQSTHLDVSHDSVSVSAAGQTAPIQTGPLVTGPSAPQTPAPTNVQPPEIEGQPISGTTLTADPGQWSGSGQLRYSWQRCDDPTSDCTAVGTNGGDYELSDADVGDYVRVTVWSTNGGGSGVATSDATTLVAAAAPVELSSPTVSGQAVEGSLLTATPGTWRWQEGQVSYTWLRCDSDSCQSIDGATSATYLLSADDVGQSVRVVVSVPGYLSDSSDRSPAIGPIESAAPTVTATPSLAGSAVVGSAVTVSGAAWSDPAATVTYAWQQCAPDGSGCLPISGATTTSYTVSPSDIGHVLEVVATASNAFGSAAVTVGTGVVPAPPIAATGPSISGDLFVGSTLTADPGSWSDPQPALSLQWLRCAADGSGCVPIDGAVGSSYTLTNDDLGFAIELLVVASGANGSASAATLSGVVGQLPAPPVAPPAPTNVTPPSISGDSSVGSTLTVDPGTWSDPAATITVQWLLCAADGSNCVPIDGATDTTYVLTTDELGSEVEAAVTATDSAGSGTAVATGVAVTAAG